MPIIFNGESFVSASPSFGSVEEVALFAHTVYPLAFKLKTSAHDFSYSYGLTVNNSIELNVRFCRDIFCNVFLSDNVRETELADVQSILDVKEISPLALLKKSIKLLPRNSRSKKYIRCYLDAFASGYTSENYFRLCEAYPLSSWTFYHISEAINGKQYVIRSQHNQDNIGEFLVATYCRTENGLEPLKSEWMRVDKEQIADEISRISLIQESNHINEYHDSIRMLKRKISINYFSEV